MSTKCEATMKVKSLKTQSKWHSPRFNISGISREELTLILSFALDGIEANPHPEVYADIRSLCQIIDHYINDDELVCSETLEVDR